jgi:hypothetical protein
VCRPTLSTKGSDSIRGLGGESLGCGVAWQEAERSYQLWKARAVVEMKSMNVQDRPDFSQRRLQQGRLAPESLRVCACLNTALG